MAREKGPGARGVTAGALVSATEHPERRQHQNHEQQELDDRVVRAHLILIILAVRSPAGVVSFTK